MRELTEGAPGKVKRNGGEAKGEGEEGEGCDSCG